MIGLMIKVLVLASVAVLSESGTPFTYDIGHFWERTIEDAIWYVLFPNDTESGS